MHESATSIGKILVLTCGTKDRKVYLSNAYRTNASFSPGFIVHLTPKKRQYKQFSSGYDDAHNKHYCSNNQQYTNSVHKKDH